MLEARAQSRTESVRRAGFPRLAGICVICEICGCSPVGAACIGVHRRFTLRVRGICGIGGICGCSPDSDETPPSASGRHCVSSAASEDGFWFLVLAGSGKAGAALPHSKAAAGCTTGIQGISGWFLVLGFWFPVQAGICGIGGICGCSPAGSACIGGSLSVSG